VLLLGDTFFRILLGRFYDFETLALYSVDSAKRIPEDTVRDGRDTVVSYAHFRLKTEKAASSGHGSPVKTSNQLRLPNGAIAHPNGSRQPIRSKNAEAGASCIHCQQAG
jgi:hypothetical protein